MSLRPEVLPPLEEDEYFSYREWWDGNENDPELVGVFVTITKGCFKLERLISLDQAYAAKFDFLRTSIMEILEELRGFASRLAR